MYVILVYDISIKGKGQRVMNRVFKTCKKYLSHVQNSVFEGEISESQIMALKKELSANIRTDKDSVIVFKSRHERWLEKDYWGLKFDATSNML